MARKKTTEEFIKRAKEIHGDMYDYSLVEYKNNKTKVKIICPVHGTFEQTPNNHLRYGCNKCGGTYKLTTEEFIKRAKEIHGDMYDYSLVEYKNAHTKVKIICPVHGVFEQRPNLHLQRRGCKKCQYNDLKKKSKTTEEFIIDAYCKHDGRYNYKLVEYKNAHTKVKIICPVHGVFEQRPNIHLKGSGCPVCAINDKSKKHKSTTEEFIEKAKKIHNNKYNYSLVDYNNAHTKIKIICPVHGVFEQRPYAHLQNNACPKCFGNISKQETELQEWLKVYIDIETNNRSLIAPYELDIAIPEKKIAIEYNGLYWHSEGQGKGYRYHLNKYLACKEKGYRLIPVSYTHLTLPTKA